jgi:hypothetical protein
MSKWYVGNEFSGGSVYHFGIFGQKWGIRRFQNEDGSLTPAGRERYGKLYDEHKRLGYSRDEINKAMTKAIKLDTGVHKYYDTTRAIVGGLNVASGVMGAVTGNPAQIGGAVAAEVVNTALHAGRNKTNFVSKSHPKAPKVLKTNKKDSAYVKNMKRDYNNMTEKEFRHAHGISKKEFAISIATGPAR